MWAALFTVYFPVQSRSGLLPVRMPHDPHCSVRKTTPTQRTPKPISQQSKGFLWSSISGIPGVSMPCTHLVSSGTLLLSTQLSCSCTDSGVVARSLGAGAGAWIWFRRLVREFLLRELAEEWWWDREWLWGGGRGGLSVDWLWWFEGPKTEKKNKSQMCVVTLLSSAFSRGHCLGKETVPLGPAGIKVWANQISHYLRSATQNRASCTAGMLTKTVFKFYNASLRILPGESLLSEAARPAA